MKEHENTRTGLQRAVDLAYAARAARRILQAAAAGGLHGAAAVAVKETPACRSRCAYRAPYGDFYGASQHLLWV